MVSKHNMILFTTIINLDLFDDAIKSQSKKQPYIVQINYWLKFQRLYWSVFKEHNSS